MKIAIALLLILSTCSSRANFFVVTNEVTGLTLNPSSKTGAVGAVRLTVIARDAGAAKNLTGLTSWAEVTASTDSFTTNLPCDIRSPTAGVVSISLNITIPDSYVVKLLASPPNNTALAFPIGWETIAIAAAPTASSGGGSGTTVVQVAVYNVTTGTAGIVSNVIEGASNDWDASTGQLIINTSPAPASAGSGIQSINGWTNQAHEFKASTGISLSNTLSGTTAITWIAFGEYAPLIPTNLTGWSRYVYTQALAGVAGATSITFTITASNGVEFVCKGFSAGGGYNGAVGSLGRYVGSLNSGDVVRIDVPQGGAARGTNGAVRAFPNGGVCTNNLTTVGNGGAAFRLYINGVLVAANGGGGGGASVAGGGGGLTGLSGSGVNAGTGATAAAGGVTGGGYLQGGDGPGAGGGEGIYGGGAGQAGATPAGGGASWWDTSVVYGEVVPLTGVATFTPPVSVSGDPDWSATITAGGGVATAGGNGLCVWYMRPR